MKKQMGSLMGMDEKQMEQVAKGNYVPQMGQRKAKKGKGKNRGGFRI